MDAGRSVVLLARDFEELNELKALLQLFSPNLSSGDMPQEKPVWEQSIITFPPYPMGASASSAWAMRMASLYALRSGKKPVAVLVSPDNLFPKLPPPEIFAFHTLSLQLGNELAPELVLEQAVNWGFTRSPMVTQPGEVAMRGDILDIFPPGYTRPARLEFFGDTLDEIRLFDAANQRSVENLERITLIPTSPIVPSAELRDRAEKWWRELARGKELDPGQAAALERALDEGGAGLLPGSYYREATSFTDWLPKDTVCLMPSEKDMDILLADSRERWKGYFSDQKAECGLSQSESAVLHDDKTVRLLWNVIPRVHFEDLATGIERGDVDLPERRYHNFSALFPQPGDLDRPWQTLLAGISAWRGANRTVVFSFVNERSRSKFLKLAENDGFSPALRLEANSITGGHGGCFALVAPFRSGVELGWANALILGEDVIQPKAERSKRVRSGAFAGLDGHDDLVPGDLLVHRDYGVATFGGLQHLEIGGIGNDFLLLYYAGDDKLYLPADRLSLVQRYKGPEGIVPPLDKLGGAGWQSSKEKARKAIEKVAKDLVEMYAYRKIAKGFTYGPLGEMFREFEASFGFEETPDQASAIQDVLDDMQRPEPMDRLVCGDVGFGKTEVALRAAFRAVTEGKQVALLCPTTVLAEQHYQTFRSRLSAFPVTVGMLSRFVSPKKQKEVLERASKGQVDILIGTHRILSGDVVLPNLSLLILDEEQRFGVRHKEKLKQIRKNVDVLTLSATPIPRTLQLSMSGIRDLSIIETAPPERKPVATMILDRDDNALRVILERELERNGQVFWVHNRVQGLEHVAEYVRKLVPSARVDMAHGQMTESALEGAMHKFWHGETDVLVCTSIVESGLDFPRANTLVVDQAHMFGLGQLYQLRGRVGRSDRQAYAVFVVNDVSRLPDQARERLRVIQEMDYLGAGFQVAMEDLRLRGSGNILGEAQSGQMAKVGLDLYLEMLEDAVSRLKGEKPYEVAETELSIGLTAHIPDTYITDPRERLRYYKALSSAPDPVVMRDVELEMRDRFGVFPEPLDNFIQVLILKRFLTRIQVRKADISPDRLKLSWGESSTAVDPARYVSWVSSRPKIVRVLSPTSLELRLPVEGAFEDRLRFARTQLEELVQGAS